MTTITVEGMSCEPCEQTIEETLRGVSGVTDAHADREAERATIEGDPDNGTLVQAVEERVTPLTRNVMTECWLRGSCTGPRYGITPTEPLEILGC